MNIFKKFKKKETNNIQTEDFDEETLKKQIAQHEETLKDSKYDDLTETLNELGKLNYQLRDIDQAIEYYEWSISEEQASETSYTELMKLYNIKNKEADEANNNTEVQEYSNKIDALMQLSKDVMRGRS